MDLLKKLLLVAAISTVANIAPAQTWTQTSAPIRSWSWVASSADGSKLVAVTTHTSVPKGIYVSTNSGATWGLVLSVSASCVAASADGSCLVALSDTSPSQSVYTSTSFGSTWQQSSPVHVSGNWISVASSADGKSLIGLNDSFGGATYLSKDAGTSWAPAGAVPLGGFCVASSADGLKLVAALSDNRIYSSTNSGTTWRTNIALSGSWMSVASSADGTRLIAATFGGKVYTSSNSGTTWKTNSVPGANWNAVASSADGSKLLAAIQGGQIYSSTNSGTTWKTNDAPSTSWTSLACSADGNLRVAADYGNGITGGGIWICQTMPSPHLNFTHSFTNLALAWMIPSTNFVLQQSSNLASWTTVTNPPALDLTNLQNELSLMPSNNAGFYRLKMP